MHSKYFPPMQKLLISILVTGLLSAIGTVRAGSYTPIDTTSHPAPTHFSTGISTGNRLYYRPLFDERQQRKLDAQTSKEWFKMTHIAGPLIISGSPLNGPNNRSTTCATLMSPTSGINTTTTCNMSRQHLCLD